MNNITYYVLSALAVLIILTVHEFAHGYAAYKLGDDTPRNLGRLTLNPMKHLDPLGALCLAFFHIGWAKPVPINTRNLKKPRRDFAIIALAGPVVNILLAFIFALVYLFTFAALKDKMFSGFNLTLLQNTLNFIYIFHLINIGIALFNLIPIPPLDGSRLLTAFLPPKAYYFLMKHERTIYYVFLGWLLLGGFVSNALLSLPIVSAIPAFSFIAKLFSLSNVLATLISLVSNGMIKFWTLIFPFLNF